MTDSEKHGYVESAMRDAAVAPLDKRGLMPLDEARALVGGATEFRKGEGRMVDGSWVLDSDRLWAALLSLEDADEFVREATRLEWFFHPRGHDNVAPLERYGAAILPWLASFVRPSGRFVNVPWCVQACLMQLGSEEVFELLWRVTCVSEGTGDEWPGPFAADNAGDADQRSGTHLDKPAPKEADDDANGLVIEWLYSQPVVGFPCLARSAHAGDSRAQRMLRSLAQCGPSEIFCYVANSMGDDVARTMFATARAPVELDETCILVTLDAAIGDGWPALFDVAPERAYHGMRLIAARARQGDGWGIVFERIEGDDSATAVLRPYCFGSDVASGPLEAEHGLWSSREDEEQDRWSDPRERAQLLLLGDDFDVVVVSDAYEHCVGEDGPDGYPAAWKVRPSQSPVFQSLARALVARDGSRFEPGKSNLDFRLHAFASVGGGDTKRS